MAGVRNGFWQRIKALLFAPTSVPERKLEVRRLSDRRIVKIGIRLVGYERLVRIYIRARHAAAWTKATLEPASRRALRERTGCIAALRANTLSARDQSGQTTPSAPAIVRQPPAAAIGLRATAGLKIGILVPSFLNGKGGGAERVAARVAQTLARAGHTVELLCRPPPPGRPSSYPLDPRVQMRPLFERDKRQIDALKKEKYDLLIGFGMRGFYLGIVEISRMLGVPFVIQECNNPAYIAQNLQRENCCRDRIDAYWLRQAVFAHAAGVRLTVPDYADSVEAAARPFTYAFFNAFEFSDSVVNARKQPAKKLIGVSMMKNKNKNGLAAIDAFGRFAARHQGWSLHLYGNNAFRAQTARLLRRHPHAAVVDHGVVDDIDEIYGDAHALLIPSYHEGLPSVVVEAFAYGIPAIGFSDCDGVRHLIKHNENGLLLDRKIVDGLDAALESIADADLRQILSVNARQFADRNLRVEHWEQNWLKLVDNAADGLNNTGRPQSPAAYDRHAPQAALWGELLQTYLKFRDQLP